MSSMMMPDDLFLYLGGVTQICVAPFSVTIPPFAGEGGGKGGAGRGSSVGVEVIVSGVLERSRKLRKDEMVLRLDEGKAVTVEAVGSLTT
ncbi:UNVERIFIED_CONTAM: hypothetical protein Sindi_0969100 [Sesamum indicum]